MINLKKIIKIEVIKSPLDLKNNNKDAMEDLDIQKDH